MPFLGFFCGSVAAAWGLVSERPRALRAAAIGAGGALLNLAGLLVAAVVMSRTGGPLSEARRSVVEADLARVASALEEYREAERVYPGTLLALQRHRGLLRPLSIIDQGAGLFVTRTYQYAPAPDRLSYDLFSVGRDGVPGTGDDVRPVVPDSLPPGAGYRPVR